MLEEQATEVLVAEPPDRAEGIAIMGDNDPEAALDGEVLDEVSGHRGSPCVSHSKIGSRERVASGMCR